MSSSSDPHASAATFCASRELPAAHAEAQRELDEALELGAQFANLGAPCRAAGEAAVALAVEVSRELGKSTAFVEEVRQVALLHGIGKLGIPDGILAKRGPLDAAEWVTMQTHPVLGEQIVGSIGALLHLAPAIRAEHERCDGKGYPDGLSRHQIPLASRIAFACGAYHAMLSARPYRPRMDARAAAAELRDKAGTQFDPDVVAALSRVLARGSC